MGITINQLNSLDNILIYPNKYLKTFVPNGQPTISGEDSFILFNKDILNIGIKTTPDTISNINNNFNIISYNFVTYKTASSSLVNLIDSEFILANTNTNGILSSNYNKFPIILSSKNSAIENTTFNSVILGGENLQLRTSNTVLVPKLMLERKADSSPQNIPSLETIDNLVNVNSTLYQNGSPLIPVGSTVPNPSTLGTILRSDGTNQIVEDLLKVSTNVEIKKPTSTTNTLIVYSDLVNGFEGRVQFEYLQTNHTPTPYAFLTSTSNGTIESLKLPPTNPSQYYLRGDGSQSLPVPNGTVGQIMTITTAPNTYSTTSIIKINTTDNFAEFTGKKEKIVEVDISLTATITLSKSDYIIYIKDSNLSPVTINLPSLTSPADDGHTFMFIKDNVSSANTILLPTYQNPTLDLATADSIVKIMFINSLWYEI